MKKPKLTPWFPADVKPVHVGAYQRRSAGEKFNYAHYEYWWWNGDFWELGGYTKAEEAAKGKTSIHTLDPFKEWRGLAKPPKEAKQKGEK